MKDTQESAAMLGYYFEKNIAKQFVKKSCRMTRASFSKGAEKHLKYSPESLEMVIDRLFDVVT